MPLLLRLTALIIAVAIILWLPIEDVGVHYVLVFAILISAWWAARFLIPYLPGSSELPGRYGRWLGRNREDAHGRRFIISHIIIGTLSGVAVSPLALLLMIFKSGLHGHGQPDFTPSQMAAVLARTPVWALAGFLTALGIAIARLARR
ncbi:MAG TPA: hypothetical protein VFZ76_07585 [Anaerolineales bacterium]